MNLLFDLDGTIIDSLPGIRASLVYAIRQQGHSIDENIDISGLIGPPMDMIVRTLLAPYGDDRIAETVNIYRKHYGQYGLYDSVPYERMISILTHLKNEKHKLFVVTSKRQRFADIILDDLNIRPFFIDVMGTPEDGSMDNKSVLLSSIIYKHGLDEKDTVMIGDRKDDIISAHNNKLLAIGVLWGYGSFDELSSNHADYICKSPDELDKVVNEVL